MMDIKEYIDKKLVHSLHTSERRAWRSCPRRHSWVYKDRLYPIVTPSALEFGVAFHKAMEAFYEPKFWNIDREVQKFLGMKAFKDECDAQLKRYQRLVGVPEVSVLEEYKERIKLGLNMFTFYAETISPHYDQTFRPVEVEVEFEVPILSPQGDAIWCKCDDCWKKFEKTDNFILGANEFRNGEWEGLPVTYGGRLDMLAIDDLGRYFVVDWKTTSRMLNEGTEEAYLELDDQVASYVWALKAHYNIPVAGFVYVEIKKAFPAPPEELSRLYKGRKFSTNKQFMTTAKLFENTVKEKDEVAYLEGSYDSHIEWLKNEGPSFHQRHQIHKNDYEIEEIGKNIYLEAFDMINHPRDYPTPGRFSCNSCLFRQPCLGKNQGEDYEYTLQTLFEKHEKHYYEEREPTTE